MLFHSKLPLRYDYLPIFSPDREIMNDVKCIKKEAASDINFYPGMNGTAHITVRDNLMNKDMYLTERCLMELEKKWRNFYSIDLDTNGFDKFNSSTGDTIYLALNQTPVNRIWFREVLLNLNTKKKSFTPHITITKNINHNAFKQLWPKYENAEHCKRFRVNRLTILRRETFNKDSHYEVFNEFFFKEELFNEAVASKCYLKKFINEKSPMLQYKLF